MSLLSPDRYRVALAPDRVLFMHRRGLLRDRIESTKTWATDTSDAAAPPWRAALDALERHLPRATGGHPKVSFALSNHFCHYAMLARRDELAGRDELLAYARHRMKAAFGDAVGTWNLKLSRAGHNGGHVASAVDGALLDRVRALCRDRNFHLVSLQPYLAVAFNRCRKALANRSAWFVVQEKGRLVVSLFRSGTWASVASRRVGSRWTIELQNVLDREKQLVEADGSECDQVLLYAPALGHVGDFKGSRYRVELLRPDTAPTSGDREYAMAA